MEKVVFNNAIESVYDIFEKELPFMSKKDVQNFIDIFYRLSIYEEEGAKIRPSIFVTNGINTVVRNIPSCQKITMHVDDNFINFRQRIKTLASFCTKEWDIYINVDDDKVEYGIVKAVNSIKEKSLQQLIFDDYCDYLAKKIYLLNITVIMGGLMFLHGIKGSHTSICFNLSEQTDIRWEDNISNFVDACVSKIKTTKRKLNDIRNMFVNIFQKVFKDLHGTICLVVDKDYKDTKGIMQDGIWLKDPIEFGKLFVQSKNFSESKLNSYADIFETMLNYDGITVVDNMGRIRAYNVFIESSLNAAKHVIGGARKRAAQTLLESKSKKIVGLYFQSQDGDNFYKETATYRARKKKLQNAEPKNQQMQLTEFIDKKDTPTPAPSIVDAQPAPAVDADNANTTPKE